MRTNLQIKARTNNRDNIRIKRKLIILLIVTANLFLLISYTYSQVNDLKNNIKLAEINYEILGSGTPILMIHGMGVDHRVMKNSFEPIFAELPNKWKRIYLDLPGMGRTKGPDWINNSDDMVDFLVQFVDKVIPDENFIVAGYSYGGYLTRGLLCKKNTNIIGAMFICPLIVPDDSKRDVPKNIFYMKDPAIVDDIDSQTKLLVDYFLVHQNPETIKRFNEDIVSGYRIADRDFVDKIRNYPKRYGFTKKLVQEFSVYGNNVLFIAAKQDILVGYSDLSNILDYFPNNTFTVIDSAGHAVQIDKQAQFENQISNYLNDLMIIRDK